MNKLLISVLVLSACLTACSKSTNVDKPKEIKPKFAVELYSGGTVVRTWHDVTSYMLYANTGAVELTLNDSTVIMVAGDFVIEPEKIIDK